MNDNPWKRLAESTPYVLAEDLDVIREFNGRKAEKHRLHIDDILPEPFVGDPAAPVLVLGNNPGYSEEGARHKHERNWENRLHSNLLHEPSDYPFAFFAPDIGDWHKQWWDRKLRGLLQVFDHAVLARSFLAVEHFPYPSRRYGCGRLRLPSGAQRYSFGLVEQAIKRKAVIVLTRGRRRWLRDVPALDGYKHLCLLKNRQKEGITRGNCEQFARIVRAIEAVIA